MISECSLKDDLLPDAAAAAAYLGPNFNRNQIYYLVRTERLRVIRKGTRMFFRKSWIDEDFSDLAAVGGS